MAYGVASIPKFIIRHPKPSAVLGGGLSIPAGVFAYMHFSDPETYLKNQDPNYKDKCFTFNQASDIKGTAAEESTVLIIGMLREFNSKGKDTAEKLEKSDEIFCFGLNNIEETAHWNTGVYVSPPRYPDQLSAMFYVSANFENFWKNAYQKPAGINQYTVESGLVFSRTARAAQAVEKIRNFYRAIETTSPRHNDLISAQWEEFLKENPSYSQTAKMYIDTIKENSNEGSAMLEALKTFMSYKTAVNDGDVVYLKEYLDHVRILSTSSYEYIYGERGLGYFVTGSDYAFVDVDRDGNKDDLIRVSGYQNETDDYNLDVSKSGYYRKQEEYDCSYTDADGNYIYQTCEQDRRENVRYDQIPARDTATQLLIADTLMQLAGKTESEFLSRADAQEIIELFIQPYSEQAAEILESIHREAEKNIPKRIALPSAAGFGVK